MNNIRNEVDGYQSLTTATIDSDSTSTDSGEYIDIKAFNNPSNSRARLFLTLTTAGVIPEVLLSSGYPGAKDLDEHRRVTRAIYDSGIEVFVNLMQEKELARFTPYEREMMRWFHQIA
ncbi:unnamed protein product [Rotaria sp. Silwood2]|nr:unnamed protein product [Rotaria sp. Silwood2]